MRWRITLALVLAVAWVRFRVLPWWLQQLALWDRRACEHAKARGDKQAAISHLARGIRRLERARDLIAGTYRA